jgi:hypothetical protein
MWVDAHNVYRCMHGAGELTWNAQIAQLAQNWADETGDDGKHSSSDYRSNKAGFSYLGENIAWASNGPPSPADAVKMWYDEIKDTDDKKGTLKGPKAGTGHYSQVVWKKTTAVGCGSFSSERGGTVICIYGPGGNNGGFDTAQAYQTNVSAEVKSIDECHR